MAWLWFVLFTLSCVVHWVISSNQKYWIAHYQKELKQKANVIELDVKALRRLRKRLTEQTDRADKLKRENKSLEQQLSKAKTAMEELAKIHNM